METLQTSVCREIFPGGGLPFGRPARAVSEGHIKCGNHGGVYTCYVSLSMARAWQRIHKINIQYQRRRCQTTDSRCTANAVSVNTELPRYYNSMLTTVVLTVSVNCLASPCSPTAMRNVGCVKYSNELPCSAICLC